MEKLSQKEGKKENKKILITKRLTLSAGTAPRQVISTLYFMNNLISLILLGIVVGAVSWGSAGIVSDRFEPFDSDIGFSIIIWASWKNSKSNAH